MNTGLPYRPPANGPGIYGWARIGTQYKTGGCFQHWRTAEAQRPKCVNVTQVANFICDITPTMIPPYFRESPNIGGTDPNTNCANPGAGPLPGDTGYCNSAPTKKPCGPWSRREFTEDVATGQTAIDVDRYVPGTGTANLAQCQKAGFKNVQARVPWYGQWGFRAQPYDLHSCQANFPIPDASSDTEQTKYLCLTFHAHAETGTFLNTVPPKYTTFWITVDVTLTMDKLSGVVTVSDRSYVCGSTNVDMTGFAGEVELALSGEISLMFAMATGTTFAQQYDYGISPNETYPDGVGTLPPPGCTDGHNYDYKICINSGGDFVPCTDSGSSVREELKETWDCSSNTHLGWTSNYYWKEDLGTGEDYTIDSKSFTADLSVPYTAQDVKDLGEAMKAEWDLSNDQIYPWRTDKFTTVAPLVSYDGPVRNKNFNSLVGFGKLNSSSEEMYAGFPYDNPPDVAGGHEWLDEDDYDATDRPYGFTGNLLGLPFADGYPQALASGTQVDQFKCPVAGAVIKLSTPGVTAVTDVSSVYKTDGSVYHTGTEGTDYTVDLVAGTITILPQAPGVTYNPMVCDEDTGSPMWLRVTYTFDSDMGGHFDFRHVNNHYWMGTDGGGCNGGDICSLVTYYGAWSGGNPGLDITDSAMPHTATQWTNHEDAWTLPHGAFSLMLPNTGIYWTQKYCEVKLPWKSQCWAGPSGAMRDLRTQGTCVKDPDTELCVYTPGSLVYPNAWPIEADRGVTFSAPVSGVITATLSAAANYLRPGDLVDFTDAAGGSVVSNSGAGFAVIDVNDGTHGTGDAGGHLWFTFAASSAPAGTQVKSHGAPGFWWWDTDGKGEFVSFQHGIKYRPSGSPTVTPTITPSCLPFNRCSPAVIAYSSNYDSGDPDSIDAFDNGKTFPMGDVTLDDRFGCAWQGGFMQIMNEQTWRRPPNTDCGSDLLDEGCVQCGWNEDSGYGGLEDDCSSGVGSKYYAHRPVVEARLTIPPVWVTGDTQPTWFTDTFVIPPLPPVGRNSFDFMPQCPPNEVPDLWAPWPLWLRMQDCICRRDGDGNPDGRFRSDYMQNLGCWMCGAPAVTVPTPLPPAVTVPRTTGSDTLTTGSDDSIGG